MVLVPLEDFPAVVGLPVGARVFGADVIGAGVAAVGADVIGAAVGAGVAAVYV